MAARLITLSLFLKAILSAHDTTLSYENEISFKLNSFLCDWLGPNPFFDREA